MSKSAAVLDAAEAWWWSRRHPGDTLAEQIEKDTSYTGIERDNERLLARHVALYVKERAEDTRR